MEFLLKDEDLHHWPTVFPSRLNISTALLIGHKLGKERNMGEHKREQKEDFFLLQLEGLLLDVQLKEEN